MRERPNGILNARKTDGILNTRKTKCAKIMPANQKSVSIILKELNDKISHCLDSLKGLDWLRVLANAVLRT